MNAFNTKVPPIDLLYRRKKLVKALRSGAYKQTTQRLRIDNQFCCLGVACDLFGTQVGYEDPTTLGAEVSAFWSTPPTSEIGDIIEHSFVVTISEDGDLSRTKLEMEGTILPPTVANWFGFTSNPILPVEARDRDGGFVSLMHLNDSGFTFYEIADLIEWCFVLPLQREIDNA